MGNAIVQKHIDQIDKSLLQTNWLFIAKKKVFSKTWFSYTHDLCVINSPESYLTKDIFVLKIESHIFEK